MDELGKSIPAAEGMVDAEQGGKRKHPNENCLNCGTKLDDAFCSHCGQKDIPKRQTLGELFENFISSFWSYEGKFFRTTKLLITRPGFLAVEYNTGRRESYYHPARMYVFISFVFFLLFVSLPDDNKGNGVTTRNTVKVDKDDLKEIKEDLKDANIPKLDSILGDSTIKFLPQDIADSLKKAQKKKKKGGWNWGLKDAEYNSVKAYDSVQQLKPESERDGWLARRGRIRGIELNQRYKGDMQEFGKDFGAAFRDNFSKVLFYLLPFFALLLKLLYVRRDYFYSEHLVYSIYYYNFFYLAGSLQMLLNQVPGVSEWTFLVGFWIYLYMLFGMKRMYKQSWRKTIFKFVLFSIAFFFLMIIAISINAMAILMMI
jgi:hypothetical protein